MMHWVFFLFVQLASATESDQFIEYANRISVLERQAEISCGDEHHAMDEVRKKFANRIISEDGSAAALISEISASVEKTNRTLETAFNSVAKQVCSEQTWNLKAKLEDATKVVTDSNREQIKTIFRKYHLLKTHSPSVVIARDPAMQVMVQNQIDALQKIKDKELQTLMKLGARATLAREKTKICLCKQSHCADNIESLEEQKKYSDAQFALMKVKAEVKYFVPRFQITANPEASMGAGQSAR